MQSSKINGNEVVGGFIADNQGNIIFVNYSGDVQVNSNSGCIAGGLAGINDGTIVFSSASGTVTDVSSCQESELGGLVGVNGFTNKTAAVGHSSAAGNVTSVVTVSFVGGLVGLSYGSIGTSSASGAAIGGSYVGGLLGENSGDVSDSLAAGAATGGDASNVGGFVGYNADGTTIDACSATGQISGGNPSLVGGAFGFTGQSPGAAYVSNCQSSGSVSAGSGSSAGGFIGYDGSPNSGYLSNDFWSVSGSGNSCAAGNSCSDKGVTAK